MIDPHEISDRVLPFLLKSGWSAGRRVDIAHWVDPLETEGYQCNETSVSVLESLGGLSVAIPPGGISPYSHELVFEPVRAAAGEVDRAEGFQATLGVSLFPLGEEIRFGNVVWASEDGKFYIGREFGLYYMGDTFGAAMDRLAFPAEPLTRCAD